MKTQLFRKVLTADRLPDDERGYDTNRGFCAYFPLIKEWHGKSVHRLSDYYVVDVDWWLEPVEVTEEKIDQVIHDICVLEERITDYIGYVNIPKDEMSKLHLRQRQAIINLLNGER
jgi:hypothetical protein